ncbi:hypothetical protein ES332_A06G155000v1 [Gossypium tomentosum]|uniref:Uncharacterized protein n=1 Tax=Gossypium tomentosum TaxID=34277 RepID=A0A5D2Q5A5_GOSTO|nr:hypothetical protein ES332_A06G155000v1 [Gossypium tomentosum]TYI23293.1 hypothetical protein ES332_A06G155000v1 [Gossypium tomentosum]
MTTIRNRRREGFANQTRCSKIWQSHRLHRAIFTRSKKSHSFPRTVSGDSRAGIENPLEWLFLSSFGIKLSRPSFAALFIH